MSNANHDPSCYGCCHCYCRGCDCCCLLVKNDAGEVVVDVLAVWAVVAMVDIVVAISAVVAACVGVVVVVVHPCSPSGSVVATNMFITCKNLSS